LKIKKEYLVGAGACFLCFLSGAINVHFVRLFSFAVGYLAGDILRLFIEASRAEHDYSGAFTLLFIIAAFIAGAIGAGLAIHHPRFDVERPYGRSLMAIGALFLVAVLFERASPMIALPIAAFASGLQNALATTYRGVILRTTHVTGIVTDFGQAVGMRLAGRRVQPWKIWLYLFLFISFLIGVAAGLFFDSISDDGGAFIIAPIYIILGGLFFVFKRRIAALHTDRSESGSQGILTPSPHTTGRTDP
jgi:uncharacterized membrane protein YoaK (UPF0700 family)